MSIRRAYNFPEKDIFHAMEATEPEFDIFKKGRENLYIRLREMQNPKQFIRILKELGFNSKGEFKHFPNDYLKVLFSGHRGCGKTVELLRFHDYINQPDRYYSVFISLQEEIEINRLEPEDLYFIIIGKLLRTLQKNKIPYDKQEFEDIAQEWIQDEEVEKELTQKFALEGGKEIKAGFSFWNWFSAKGFLKGFYGYENATTRKIRHSIKLNPDRLATQFNTALIDVRKDIQESGNGKDLLFIIDDFEKTSPEVYEAIFIKNHQFIRRMNAHVICCVPIQTFYQVQNQAASEFFRTSYLPMIRADKDDEHNFKKIITNRVDSSLFAEGVLDKIVDMSGGSPRQLLRIVNQCLLDADEVVTMQIAEETFQRLAVERLRPLSGNHRRLLESRSFNNISKDLLDLLYSLNVMEYNGDNIERRINPLLASYFPRKLAH